MNLEKYPDDESDQNIPQIAITFEQLHKSATEVQPRRKKRPDVAIYKPSRRSQNNDEQGEHIPKALDEEKDVSKSCSPSSSASCVTPTESAKSAARVRKKRPDQTRYTPKSRSSGKTETPGALIQKPTDDVAISGVTSNESTNNTHKRERVVEKDKGESSQETKTYADPHVNNKNNREKKKPLSSSSKSKNNSLQLAEQNHNAKKSTQSHSRSSSARPKPKEKTQESISHKSDTTTENEGCKSSQQSADQSRHRQKSVSFINPNSENNPSTRDINLEELELEIETIAPNPQSHKNEGRDMSKQIYDHRQTTPQIRDDTRRVPHSNKQDRNSRNKAKTRLKSDDRLYDPNKHNTKPDRQKEPGKGGLIRLPTETSEPETRNSRGDGRFLYDPDNPDAKVPDYRRQECNSSDPRLMGGDGDYYMTSSQLMSQQAQGSASSAMYNMMSGVSANMYPTTMSYFDPSVYAMPQDNPHLTTNTSTISPSSGSDSGKHRKVTLLIRDVVPLDRQLQALTAKRLETRSFEHLKRLRSTVREKLEQIILLDTEYSTNHNVDQLLWRSVYHQILENLRKELQEEDNSETRTSISQILNEAEENYRQFLERIERQYKFDLGEFVVPHRAQSTNRSLKIALLMSQRILIYLGDIARYRTQNEQTADYGRARKWYLQASHVAAKNGKPYNQLAIIALSAKRKMDTVYYFMRSVSASNAFVSAKESLRAIYNDIIKKYIQTRQQAEKAASQKKTDINSAHYRQRHHESSHKRVEMWISPIDGSSVTDTVDDNLDDPNKMPCNELYRKLMSSYLSCQGMIFSKVGMEQFPEVSSELLYQFEALLNHSPVPLLNSTKLIQMFSICMFSIQNAGIQVDPGSMETETCRSFIQEQAILLLLDMATVVTRRCTKLLTSHSRVSRTQLLSHDLVLLLPIVKLCADWMTCHLHLWNPAPCPRDPTLGPVLDPWQSLAELANLLTQIDTHHVKFYSADDIDGNHNQELEWLHNQEELDLKGFMPLMNMSQDDVFIRTDTVDQVEAGMCYRVGKLITFADYLCGIEPPMLDYDTRTAQYTSVVAPPSLSEKTTSNISSQDSQLNADRGELSALQSGDEYSDSSSEDEGVSGMTSDLRDLRRAKKHLSRQLERQQRQERAHQAVIESEDHLLRLEVRPIFIIPDTNCFIEYMQYMEKLIVSQKFTVVVPLVVINELDGLSHVAPKGKYADAEHSAMVRREALSAVSFLESQFDSRNRRLKALTQSGTELQTISYRSEETSSIGTNDDKILSCCLHYCKDNARDFMPKNRSDGGAITLHREVVLLTDDRNLRLKAHTRNVPVKDLLQFMEWAKLS